MGLTADPPAGIEDDDAPHGPAPAQDRGQQDERSLGTDQETELDRKGQKAVVRPA